MKKAGRILLFIIIQIILYGWFMTVDLTDGSINLSSRIKFCLIVLCFFYVLTVDKTDRGRLVLNLSRMAMLFTVVSDLCILMLDYYFTGVLTFIIVQQLYGLRLLILRKEDSLTGKSIRVSYLLRVSIQLILAAMILLVLSFTGALLDRLTVITVFYFISIINNVITAVRYAINSPKERSNILYAAGMILFLLCDINVGLFNLADFISLPGNGYQVIYSAAAILMWAFYAPSQVLIALSADRKNY